jgi:hypothetical protein
VESELVGTFEVTATVVAEFVVADEVSTAIPLETPAVGSWLSVS